MQTTTRDHAGARQNARRRVLAPAHRSAMTRLLSALYSPMLAVRNETWHASGRRGSTIRHGLARRRARQHSQATLPQASLVVAVSSHQAPTSCIPLGRFQPSSQSENTERGEEGAPGSRASRRGNAHSDGYMHASSRARQRALTVLPWHGMGPPKPSYVAQPSTNPCTAHPRSDSATPRAARPHQLTGSTRWRLLLNAPAIRRPC
eukprot:363525-Chlamydomonas_euryale.AAC.10